MGHYKSNLRDIEFNLFEVFGTDESLGTGPFGQLDLDTGAGRAARGRPARHQRPGGVASPTPTATRRCSTRRPARSRCRTSFKKSYSAYVDGDWDASTCGRARRHRRPALTALGLRRDGAAAPTRPSTCSPPDPVFAQILDRNGTPEQKRFAELVIERHWGATMVLTEPDAGSDVGAGRAKAHAAARRHLAHRGREALHHQRRVGLAREHRPPRPRATGGRRGRRRPGHQGPVAVPRARSSASTRTARSASATASTSPNVEKKMGLKVSTTCELTFGEKHPAIGTLVGDVHDGIAQMFEVIEYARMMVGTKAIATLSTGYLNALEYAKQRVQGADLTQMTDKTAPRVVDHQPPRRAPDAHAAEGVRRGHARARPLHRDGAGPGRDLARTTARSTTSRCAQRPAAADRQGLRLGEGVRAARDVAAGLRRLRLHPGLPDRAVHPRRQDRHAVRGHDDDPGHGPVLPQDRARQGTGPRQARAGDPGVREGRRRQRRPRRRSASCSRPRSRTSRGSSTTWSTT